MHFLSHSVYIWFYLTFSISIGLLRKFVCSQWNSKKEIIIVVIIICLRCKGGKKDSSDSYFICFMHRYDLLCLEGLAQALRVFNKEEEIPSYTLANISREKIIKLHVKPEVIILVRCMFVSQVF